MKVLDPNNRSVLHKISTHLRNSQLVAVMILALTIPVTFYMVSQRQDIRQRAASTDSFTTTRTMNLTATFNSIGIEVFFDGDINRNATATLEFKKKSDSNWRKGLDLWGTYANEKDTTESAFYGSALLLDHNTEYDVRVTVQDADSVQGQSILTGSIKTKADTIPQASSLQATHFVRVDGNDTNPGTSDSATGAWKTIAHALASAPDGSVIEVGPGHHTVSGKLSTSKKVTLKAKYPALDDNRNEINTDRRSIIEYGVVSGPTGSTASHQNIWTPETFIGPNSGKTYTLYKWTNKPFPSKPAYLGYAATRAAMPQRITYVKMKNEWTDAKRAEFMYENNSFNYGWFLSQTDSKTVYLRLPPTSPGGNPNNLYITMGFGTGIDIKTTGTSNSTDNFRISGFEIRGFNSGIAFSHPAAFGVADHNLIGGISRGFSFNATRGTPPVYGSDHVIQYNKVVDSNLRAKPGQSSVGMIPWPFVKGESTDPYGAAQKRTGEDSETGSVDGTGGAKRVVIRHNTFEGTFNGIGTYENGYDKYTSQDMDVYENLFQNIADDAILENEPNSINQRIWNNRFQYVSVMASMARAQFGPHYIFRNTVWQLGSQEVPGKHSNPADKGVSTLLFKMSGGHRIQPIVYLINNTVWSNQPRAKAWQITNSGEGDPPLFYMRNNLIHLTWRLAHDGIRRQNWNEDYNSLTVDGSYADGAQLAGHRWEGINSQLYRTIEDLQEYRTKTGGAAHTNTIDGSDYAFIDKSLIDAMIESPVGGNLTIKQNSGLVDSGIPIPNLSDNYDAKSAYIGNAPDLGAVEVGGRTTSISPTITTTVTPSPTEIITQPPTATPTTNIQATPTTAVENNGPTLTLRRPIDGSTVEAGSRVGIAASAKDPDGVKYVLFYVNDALIKVDTVDSYNASWDVPNTPGATYVIKAVAVDKKDNQSTATVSVTAE